MATGLLDRTFMLRIRRVIPTFETWRAFSENFGGLQARRRQRWAKAKNPRILKSFVPRVIWPLSPIGQKMSTRSHRPSGKGKHDAGEHHGRTGHAQDGSKPHIADGQPEADAHAMKHCGRQGESRRIGQTRRFRRHFGAVSIAGKREILRQARLRPKPAASPQRQREGREEERRRGCPFPPSEAESQPFPEARPRVMTPTKLARKSGPDGPASNT